MSVAVLVYLKVAQMPRPPRHKRGIDQPLQQERACSSAKAEDRPLKQEHVCKKEDTMSNFEIGNVRNQKNNLEFHAADLGIACAKSKE